MAPRATVQDESQRPLTKHELPADKTTYIVRRTDMEELLKKTFGAGLDFNVSVRQTDKPTTPCRGTGKVGESKQRQYKAEAKIIPTRRRTADGFITQRGN